MFLDIKFVAVMDGVRTLPLLTKAGHDMELVVKAKSKAAAGVRALARRHSKAAVKVLAAIMNDEEGPATARVSAAQALLDRGWGKAAQPVAGEEGGLAILARIERVIVDPSLKTNNENGSGTDNGAHT